MSDTESTIARDIATAKATALDEASAELNRRLVAEMDGPRKNESTTRRISFGQGVQLGKRVLREMAAAERNSAGSATEDRAEARISEEQIIERLGSFSSAAVGRIVAAGERTMLGRFEDGVFE